MARFPKTFPAFFYSYCHQRRRRWYTEEQIQQHTPQPAGLFVEVICAAMQTPARIVLLVRTRYSRVEKPAAGLTVLVNAVLLLVEAEKAAPSM